MCKEVKAGTVQEETKLRLRNAEESMRFFLLNGRPEIAAKVDQVAFLQCQLGEAYEIRLYGFEEDIPKAKMLYEKALGMGYSTAGYYLGELIHMHGGDASDAVDAMQRATQRCNCWTDGNCEDSVNDCVDGYTKDFHHSWRLLGNITLAQWHEFGDLSGKCAGAHTRT
jgi:hypothetical protein